MTRPRPKTPEPPKQGRRPRLAKPLPLHLRTPEEQARFEVLYREIDRRLAALQAARDAAAARR
ncbi:MULTISPECIES: hypothetical protein [unclassified Caulobacter]|uniref:hypothetical protein n=1 Tax=unclassified Caulobacter TaxID=2648921 RepID=UPI0004A73893|nr:hypothetical protein [Caulobacter sp. UNC358MFTsu5.1]